MDWDSGREQRRRFIDGRTKRFLDERRADMGEAGAEAEVEVGRKRTGEEVAGLEAIVGMGTGRGMGD